MSKILKRNGVILKPFCQCVQLNSGTLSVHGRETTTQDGYTCDKCEHYVVWKNHETVYNGARKDMDRREEKRNRDKFYLTEYSLGL